MTKIIEDGLLFCKGHLSNTSIHFFLQFFDLIIQQKCFLQKFIENLGIHLSLNTLSLSYSFSPLPLSFSIFLPHSFSTFLSISTSLYISLSISTSLSLSLFLPLYLSLSTSPHSNSCSVFFVFWVYDKIWQQVPSPFRISFKCTLTNLKQLTPVLNL